MLDHMHCIPNVCIGGPRHFYVTAMFSGSPSGEDGGVTDDDSITGKDVCTSLWLEAPERGGFVRPLDRLNLPAVMCEESQHPRHTFHQSGAIEGQTSPALQ